MSRVARAARWNVELVDDVSCGGFFGYLLARARG
jgi:hypothetical protein